MVEIRFKLPFKWQYISAKALFRAKNSIQKMGDVVLTFIARLLLENKMTDIQVCPFRE